MNVLTSTRFFLHMGWLMLSTLSHLKTCITLEMKGSVPFGRKSTRYQEYMDQSSQGPSPTLGHHLPLSFTSMFLPSYLITGCTYFITFSFILYDSKLLYFFYMERVLDRDVGFRLAVHSPQDVPNLANTPLRLKPGRAYTTTFTPQETTSDKDVEALALKQRSCRFPHETEGVLTIFENYTQSAWYLFHAILCF